MLTKRVAVWNILALLLGVAIGVASANAAGSSPLLDLELDGSLDTGNAGIAATPIGSVASYANGIMDPEQALLCNGNTHLKIDGMSNALPEFTISAWVYIDDFRQEPEITLLESQGTGSKLRWYFHTTNPADFNTRETRLVLSVDGNSGGNGPTADSIQSLYRRFGEHEISYQPVTTYGHAHEQCWFHVALTYNSTTKTVTTFLHGELGKAFQLTAAQAVSFEQLLVAPTADANKQFHGRLRELKVFDSVLSRDEIRALGDFTQKLWAVRDIEQWNTPGTILYVDDATGNDSNSGSSSSPFKTISKGLASISGPGTKLVVRPGTYYESELQMTQSGTRFEPVIIEAETPGTVIIDGASSFNATWTPTGTSNRYSATWPHAWGFTAGTDDLGHRRELLLQNGTMLSPVGSVAELSDGTFHVDEAGSTVTLQTTLDPTTNQIELCDNTYMLKMANLSYVVIRGLTFQHCGGFAYDGAVQLNFLKHLLIEDCIVRNSNSGGIWGGANFGGTPDKQFDYVIRRCDMLRIGGWTLKTGWDAGYVLVKDCASRNSLWRVPLGIDANPSTFGKNLFCGHILYRRCIFEDNGSNDIWVDHWNWNVTVDQCAFNGSKRGIWYEINSQGCVVRNSSFSDCTASAMSLASESIIVENNVVKAYGPSWGVAGAPTWEGDHRIITNRIPYLHNYYEYFDNNTIVGKTSGQKLAISYHPDTIRRSNNRYFTIGGANSFRANDTSYDWAGWTGLSMEVAEVGSSELASDPFVNTSPKVGFTQSYIEVQEANAAVVIPINISEPTDLTLQVDLQASSGTAVAGTDFHLLTDNTLKFVPLQIYHTAAIAIYRDGLPEGTEEFTLQLSNPQNAALGTFDTLTVYIGTAPPPSSVEYDGNGNTDGTAPATQTKELGEDLILASNSGNLVKTGSSFAGWNTAADGTGTDYAEGATYSTHADLTLYAKWTTLPTYTVAYNGNGNTAGTAPVNQTKTQGINLTLASNSGALVKTGHTFAGWNTSADGTGTDYAEGAAYTADSSVTLYAKWSINTYTVSYDGNGSTGGSVPSDQTKAYGVDLTLASNSGALVKTGHFLAGWNTSADGTGTDYAVGATYSENFGVTLYAKWINENLVANGDFELGYSTGWNHLAGNGSSATYSDETTSPYQGSHALKNVITALGSNGWDVQSQGSTLSLTVGNDYTLTFWGKAAASGTQVRMVIQENGVSFLANTKSLGTEWAQYTWTFTAASTMPSIRVWYIQTGTVWLDDIQLKPQTYTVTYDGNGKTGGAVPANQTKVQGFDLTLAANSGSLAKTGYTFAGWNTAADGTGTDYAENAIYTTDADLVLFAKWALETCTLMVDSAHGSPNPSGTTTPVSNSVVNAWVDAEVTSGTTQYVCTGWVGTGSVTSGSGTNTSFTITNDTTITWLWETNVLSGYTVIFDEGAHGTRTGGGALTQSVEEATSATPPTITPSSGYTFDGWDSMSYTNVTSNMTIHAQYSAITYTLTYQAGANGSISGTATQTVSHGGDGSAVTAVADGGHHFVSWSDTSTVNPRTDTGVMGDITVMASFAANVPPVVDHGAGATDLSETSAQISGQLTSGGNAAAWFCWGLTDGGIANTGDWDNVISMGAVVQGVPFATNVTGLATNTTYFYRCYATNEYGADWSNPAESFSGTPVGAGSSWTPAEIATVAWYDAADSDTVLLNGSSVSNWLDKSGNARHAIQTNEVNQPTYDATDAMVSNLPSIGDISGSGSIGLDTPSFAAKHVYVVTYYKDGVDAAFDTYDTLLSGPAQYGQYRVTGASGSSNFILAGNYQFNDAGNYKNGSTNDSGAVLPMHASLLKMKSTVARSQVYALGYNQDSNTRDWKGAYCEWIFTDGAEDAATEQKIEGYLAHKWKLSANLPVDHPHKDNAPGGGGGIIANMAATDIMANGAVLRASVDASGTDYDVYVFWGTSNGGTNAGSWSTNAHVGSLTNVSTNVSFAADSLFAGTTNYYTFLASNATEMVWASPSWQFMTLGTATPVVTCSLTVSSLYGTPSPSGSSTPVSNSVVNAWISDASITNGLTNYVCTGWVRDGSEPGTGSGTNMSFTITNDTTITWQWKTNYWVEFGVQSN